MEAGSWPKLKKVSRPQRRTDEMVSAPPNGCLHTRAHAIEHDDLSEPAHLETDRIDLHLFQDSKKLALDVECGQTLVWQWFQPAFDTLQQVVVQDRLLQMRPKRATQTRKVDQHT